MPNIPRCSFSVRTPMEGQPGKFRYDRISLLDSQPGISLATPHPPLLGDFIILAGGVYEVLGRTWSYPQYGSMDFPLNADEPRWGPILDIVVCHVEGMFADEAETEEDAAERL